ncbi:IS66 family transposase [Pseudoduganella namucuonensis]|nr:transposase [Pseudoduganella namucuonensis]
MRRSASVVSAVGRAACWSWNLRRACALCGAPHKAHIRRKFFDVHAASASPVADEALQRIAALYAIEQQGAGLDPPQRLVLRQRLAEPALAEAHAWLLATRRAVAAGSGTAKGVEHALKRWPALERYAGSGTLPIDNNRCENAIRPIAIGKKLAVHRLGTSGPPRRRHPELVRHRQAQRNGLDPARWLADALERLPTCPNSQIDSPLPFPDFIQS